MHRFRYPNVILIYITFTRIALCIFHLVGYTDEKALYCTSRDRVTSFEEGSAYCNIIGRRNVETCCILNKMHLAIGLIFMWVFGRNVVKILLS